MRIAMTGPLLAAGSLFALYGCMDSRGETRAGTAGQSPSFAAQRGVARGLSKGGRTAHKFRSPDGPRDAVERTGAREAEHRMGSAKSTGTTETPAVTFGGAPGVQSPKVVPVIFPNNPYDAKVRDFFTKLAGSSYWQAATSEYGVGAITTLPAYVPSVPAPSSATVDQWIADFASDPASGLPAPDDNTIYAIVLPVGWGADSSACVRWGAYHGATYTASGQMVNHAIIPTCAVPYLGVIGIDQLTFALSHELVEASTDATGYGYQGVNWAASGTASAAEGGPGGETADMCEFQPHVAYVDPQIGYLVQRSWSNRASSGGHDPCAPTLPSDPIYFTAEPVLYEGTQVSPGTYSRGVSIAPGSEVTVPVVLRADGPIGELTLSAAEEANPHLQADIYNELSFKWDHPKGRVGETRYLTIHRSPPPDAGIPVFLRVAVNATVGAVTHTSWLVVGTE